MTALLDRALAARVLAELRAQLATGYRLQAITVWQPWSWAILHAGKPAENRTWVLPRHLAGKWVALHAGAGQSGRQLADDSESIREMFAINVPPSLPRRALVGLVKFSSAHRLERLPRPTTEWDCGPWCWDVGDRLALPKPVLASGAQGFWIVPDDLVGQVLEQLTSPPAAGTGQIACGKCGAPATGVGGSVAEGSTHLPLCGACLAPADVFVPLAEMSADRIRRLAEAFPFTRPEEGQP